MSLYIGLMSGTSADAIDATVIETSNDRIKVLAAQSYPLEDSIRQTILSLYKPGNDEIDRVGELDNILGHAFADAVMQLLIDSSLKPQAITAIGSHGQTIRHRPNIKNGNAFTLQIGNPNVIAQRTGITTIADFRRRDMACGGQGAPLTPAFHQFAFASTSHNRAILNIGGIANLTFLPIEGPVIGFDTGPGNGLMDSWIEKHRKKKYDRDGCWALTGKVHDELITELMSTPYILSEPPKSTGREAFSSSWLETVLSNYSGISIEDIQATLLEFTAQSIRTHIQAYCPEGTEIYVCGGGVYNSSLMNRLKQLLTKYPLDSTEKLGIKPDDVEAVTFAWLAMRTWKGLHGNLPTVTGARDSAILGCIYPA